MRLSSFRYSIGKCVIGGVLAIATGFSAIGIYARIWEARQPTRLIEGARVVSIEPYSFYNDLHWNAKGYRIKVEGLELMIDFPERAWDKTVQVGDSVDLIVRKSFPLFGDEYDGLRIDDHE
ncbi:hypothetical protein DRJ48_01330 [Candidatus Woesearchaeota archaeon]|nr:MAG: hypothetical protein DRJ48_01330 [Candidatus Woesearchaeota archaeon]